MRWRKNKDGTYSFRVNLHEVGMIHRALDEMVWVCYHRNDGVWVALRGLDRGDPLLEKLWAEYEGSLARDSEWGDLRSEFDTLRLIEEIEGRKLKEADREG